MRGVTYRFRIEARARWRAWLVLAMLVGAVAGTSLVLLAGSRRTGSAYERFAREQRAYDVGLVVSCEPGKPPEPRAQPRCHDAVARLPAVESATTGSSLPAFIETTDGQSLQPDNADACYSGPGRVETLFDTSGRFGTTINRSRLVAGRRANPAAADEVVISRDTAQRLRLGPGSELRIRLLGGADCLDEATKWRAPQSVRIVGVQLSPGEVRPPSGNFFQWVELTPAFVRRAGAVPDRGDYLIARLKPGVEPDALLAQAQKAGYDAEIVVSQAENARAVERAIRPNEVSLGILAALTALAAVVVLGQVLVRQASAESADDAMLAALGMRTRERVVLAVLRGGAVGIVAVVVAVVTAIAFSPFMPIGLARTVEPARGVATDWTVLGFGALVTVVFVVAVSAATAGRLAMRRDRDVRVKRAALAGTAARAGFSPAAVSGIRFALERGSGSNAVPVASSFAGLTIAVAAVVGALTFGAGLTHLRETPRLSGWNWDVILPYPELDDTNASLMSAARERVRDALESDRGVTEVATGTIWPTFPQGRGLQIGSKRTDVGGFMSFDGSAPFGPSVISGRKPSAANEILLGPRTLSTLGLRIGDRVDVYGQAGTWERPGKETSARMTIVGTGLAPMTESIGRGATLTLEGLRRLSPGATEQAWFVRVESAADRRAAIEGFRSAFPDSAPEAIEAFEIESVARPSMNLAQIGSVPALFAAIMGLMAAAVLAHVLTVAGRARRRDLAILRALGFSRGQTLRTVAWESTVYALGALLIGVPIGVVSGRAVWRIYATNLGAVPEPVTPWVACAAVIAATLALAGVLAIVPALQAWRSRPGEVLHTE